uniref:Amino acid transporter transmembrane domain-containing protein n=1 Tax=Chloropicon laureae TaxID=464258 RepID=A0A7S3E6Q2_9CHLO
MEKSGDEGGKGAASKAAEVLVSSFRVTLDPACMDAPSMILNTSSVDASVRSAAVRGPARSLVSSIRSADGSLREDFKRSGDEVDLHHGPAQVSEWYNTTANLLAEVMGTGLLSLPSTVAGLGYILGSISIVTFAVAIFYSGSVLAKVKNRYAKHVLSYGDMAFILHGKPFEVATRWLLYANWYFLMCYYTLALASSLQAAFYWNESLCFWMWGLIGCAILLPFIQLRTLHAISYMSFASTVSIIAAVAVIVASFLTGNTEEGANYVPATLGVPKQSFLSGYTNLANIIFAFQGQSMFYEMAAEMKNPRHFAVPSLLTAQVIMCFFYLFTALIAYTYGGQNVNGFILYSLPQNKLRTVCAILIAFHILVAYGECDPTQLAKEKPSPSLSVPSLNLND